MSLSNIGKIVKASKNVDDLSDVLKSFGKYEKALDILGKVKNIDEKIKVDALKYAFNDVDSAKIASDLNNVGNSATDVGGKLKEMASTGKSALSGLWAVIKAHPFITMAVAATAAVAIINKLTVTAQESLDALSDMQSEYESNKSELESLNSELEITQERMEELQVKGHLTLTEQEELSNLQAQNAELERTIALKEAEQKIDAKANAKQAEETYEKWTNTQDIFGDSVEDRSFSRKAIDEYKKNNFNVYGSKEQIEAIKNSATSSWFDNFWNGSGTALESSYINSRTEDINYLIAAYESLQEAQKNVGEELDNITSKGSNLSEDELAQAQALQEYYDDIESKSVDVQSAMSEYMKAIQSVYDAYKEADNQGVISQSQKEQLVEIESVLSDYLKIVTNTAGDTEDAINNIFAKSQFINLKDRLVQAGKTGEDVLNGVINKTPGLTKNLDKAGVSAKQLSDYIMAIADPNSLRINEIKDLLKNQFVSEKYNNNFKIGEYADQAWNEFIGDKSDKEIEVFYKYITDNNLNMSDWTNSDLEANFKKSQKDIKNALKKDPISLADLFDKGEEAPSTLQDITDQFQSNISSIKSAMDSLKTGDFKSSDITDLIQQFPELSSETDNLEQGLSKLTLTKLNDSLIGIRGKTKDITDPEKKKNVEKYIQALMDSVDMSNVSFDNVQKTIRDNLLSSVGSDFNKEILGNNINKLFSMYADDENAMTAILKLSADPSMAYAIITEWIDKIESLRPQIEIDVNAKKLAELEKDLSYIQNDASRIQSEMDNKTALGLKVNESDYAKLISNGNDQIANLKEQIKLKEEDLKKYKDNEEKTKEYQSAIDECNASIDSMIVSQHEWVEAMQNLPVTNAQNLTSVMSTAFSEIQSSTGLTSDSIETLKTQFSDLEGYDPTDLFYNSAKGVKVNTGELKNMLQAQNKIVSGQFRDEIKRQRSEIEKYQKEIGKNTTDSKMKSMQSNLERLLQRQSQYYAQYQSQMDQLSKYQAIQDAKNTENAGSHYDQIMSDVKAAKEAYDKDLVGTDDFKSIAAYLSPYGFEDAANFAENYAKYQRYYTEDSKGILNFLQDLNKKGYATYETLSNGVKQWSLNIKDAKDAALDMGMGEEFFMDTLNKTEDYGFVNAIVSSVDEGEMKIEEASTKLVDAYAKLAEMQATGASTSAIEQQKQVISELEGHVDNLNLSLEEFKITSAESYASGLSGLKDQVSYLNEMRKAAEYNGDYLVAEGLGNKIENLGKEYGVKISNFEVDEDSWNQALKDIGIGSFENPLSAEELGLTLNSAEMSNFDSTRDKLIEQKDALYDYFSVLRQYSAEDLSGIVLGDKQYNVEGLEGAEDALQAIADQAGLSSEQASQLLNVLKSIGILNPEIDINMPNIDEGISKLERMQELGQINSNIDLTADISGMSDDELSNRYNDLINIKAKIVPDTAEYDAVCTLIEQTSLQMKINTAIETAGGVDELLALGRDGIQTAVQCEDSEVDTVISKLEEMKNGTNIPITVQLSEEQFSQLAGPKDTTTITVDANNEPAKEKIDEAKKYGDKQKSKIKVEANTTPAISATNVAVANINHRTATIKIDGNTNNLINAVNAAVASINHRTATITVKKKGAESGAVSSGTMLSPAHASGTAYNVLNMKPAYAGGKVALSKNEEALVNELGTESIIRDGVWSLIPGGMHVENLKKGDIVLSAKQTSDLLKTGKAQGHARALAEGTLAYDGISSYATSSINGGGAIGGNKYTSGSASNLDQASSNLNNASSNLSSAADSVSDAADDTKEAFDYIQLRLDRLQRKYDDYVRQAENAGLLSHKIENYNRANETIAEQIAANEMGALRYAQEANSVGLDASLAAAIIDGTIDIQKYDEDTQNLIADYQQWYELALDCQDAVKELKVQQKELAQSKIDAIVDQYDRLAEYADARTTIRNNELDYREAAGYSSTAKRQQALYQDSIKMEQYKLDKNQALADNLRNEITYQLNTGIMSKYDDAWYDAQIKLREFQQAVYESKTAIAEYNQELRAMKTTKFQRLLDRFSRWANQLQSVINLKEARGYNITEKNYQSQITANNDQIRAQNLLLNDYISEQASYEYGSEKWQELAEKIADAKNNILSLLVANEELKNSIVTERWESFDKLQSDIDNTIVELDYLRNALEASVDPLGNITDDGFANIALIGKGMALEKQRIADYNTALEKLNQELRVGNIDQNEYNERQLEYQKIIRESASAVKDYEDELIDLWSTQMKNRNEALQEEIDLRQKALKEKKDYYDYDKQLKSQTKEINLLKAQAAALEGVGDAASKKKLAKLKEQIRDAEEDLADTKYEHTYDLKVTGYDTLKDDLQEELDKTLDELEINSELQQNVVDAMLGNIKTNYQTAYTEINTVIGESGLVLSSTAIQAVEGFNSITDAVNSLSEAIKAIPEYNPSETISSVDTSKIVTNVASNGKTTIDAEKAAKKRENTSNNAGNLLASNKTAATSLSIDKSSVTMYVGETTTVSLKASPSNAQTNITWKTSNGNVATIWYATGVITANGVGSATLTATDSISGKKVSCKVTVKDRPAIQAQPATHPQNTSSQNSANNVPQNTVPNIFDGIAQDTSMKGASGLDIDQSIVDRMKYNGYKADKSSLARLWQNLSGSGTYSGTATQNIWLLNKLKQTGYAQGGLVDRYIPADMLGFLGNAVIRNGDDGIIGIKKGELVLPPNTVSPALKIMKDFAESSNNNYYARSNNPIVISSLITVNGNVDKNVMEDLKSLGKELANNKEFVNSMTNKISTNITGDAYKAGFVKRVR